MLYGCGRFIAEFSFSAAILWAKMVYWGIVMRALQGVTKPSIQTCVMNLWHVLGKEAEWIVVGGGVNPLCSRHSLLHSRIYPHINKTLSAEEKLCSTQTHGVALY